MPHIIIDKPITAIRDIDTLVVVGARSRLGGVREPAAPPDSPARRTVEIEVS
jgi:hypothetical protein